MKRIAAFDKNQADEKIKLEESRSLASGGYDTAAVVLEPVV
jgi:hypothetical protein